MPDRIEVYVLGVAAEYLDKPRHMRAFEVMGQAHIHIDTGNSALFALVAVGENDGVADIFDTDAVNVEVSMIPLILNIFQYYLLLPILWLARNC